MFNAKQIQNSVQTTARKSQTPIIIIGGTVLIILGGWISTGGLTPKCDIQQLEDTCTVAKAKEIHSTNAQYINNLQSQNSEIENQLQVKK